MRLRAEDARVGLLVHGVARACGALQATNIQNCQVATAVADEMATLQKFSTTGMVNSETQRFRLDAGQSYVDAATKAKDPAFWSARTKQ